MLWLTCPHCGSRPVEEWRFGGEIPTAPAHLNAAERDFDLVWNFNNVEGPSEERWFHFGGCRRWITIRRDTRTDEVV